MTTPSAHRQVSVVGAGAMGAGIAQVAAMAGHSVTLVDAVTGAAEDGVARIIAALQRLEAKGRIDSARLEAVAQRLSTVTTVAELPQSALVIEAVREDLDVKQRLFAELAAHPSHRTRPREQHLEPRPDRDRRVGA